MANKKRILSFVLALVMVLTVVMQLVACGPDNTDTSSDTGTNTNTGSTNTDTGNQNADKVGYTVNVKSIGGMALEGVKVYVADAEGNIKKEGMGAASVEQSSP